MNNIKTDSINLISVIVPVYNVELYLRRCIESIIKQTYKKLEIILIDDGSTDNSGKICDEYVLKDSRIKVIHKNNGGLSSARNCGIEVANGDYLTFVDSDDWLKFDFIENLAYYANKYSADIVSSRMIIAYQKNNEYIYNKPRKFKTSILTKEEALENLLYKKSITHTACAKLIKKIVFNIIRFPQGKIYEDFATTYKIIDVSNIIISIETTGYYYYQRFGSIVNNNFSERDLDGLFIAKEIINFINTKYPRLIYAAYTAYEDILHLLYIKLIKSSNKNYNYLKKEFYKQLLLNSKYVLLNIKSRNKLKIKILFIIIGEYLIRLILFLLNIKIKLSL